jgi:hypothetical protein
MADIVNRAPETGLVRARTPWGAIWAGVFSFVAIWSIFGFLGAAIFASSGSSPSNSVGMGIWSVVLTMIAMYVGGRVTAHLAAGTNRADGTICGTTMFGLAVISTLIVFSVRAAAIHGAAIAAPHLLSMSPTVDWFGFAALLLGWLCAMGGASSVRRAEMQAAPREIRTAA